jgi:hypothetical protein
MEDFASAAARHWDGTAALAQAARWQEAAYLGGYVAECVWKALLKRLSPAIVVRELGHCLIDLSGDALDVSLLLSPPMRRYQRNVSTAIVNGWTPEQRYATTDPSGITRFQQMVAEAETVGREVLLAMVLDGILPEVPQ